MVRRNEELDQSVYFLVYLSNYNLLTSESCGSDCKLRASDRSVRAPTCVIKGLTAPKL